MHNNIPQFWCLLCYGRPYSKVYKITIGIFYGIIKYCALLLNYRHQFKFVLFDIKLQNMLLGETFRVAYLKCVSCNGKLVKIAF